MRSKRPGGPANGICTQWSRCQAPAPALAEAGARSPGSVSGSAKPPTRSIASAKWSHQARPSPSRRQVLRTMPSLSISRWMWPMAAAAAASAGAGSLSKSRPVPWRSSSVSGSTTLPLRTRAWPSRASSGASSPPGSTRIRSRPTARGPAGQGRRVSRWRALRHAARLLAWDRVGRVQRESPAGYRVSAGAGGSHRWPFAVAVIARDRPDSVAPDREGCRLAARCAPGPGPAQARACTGRASPAFAPTLWSPSMMSRSSLRLVIRRIGTGTTARSRMARMTSGPGMSGSSQSTMNRSKVSLGNTRISALTFSKRWQSWPMDVTTALTRCSCAGSSSTAAMRMWLGRIGQWDT